ncbi:ap-4 complex subunit, partial [Chrysochromulina tobinii]
MATLSAADLGRRVQVTTSDGEASEGTVFAVEDGVVVLESFCWPSNPEITRANYSVLTAASITKVAEVAAVPSGAAAQERSLPAVDSAYLQAREARAVTRAEEEATKINPKATARFQAVFDMLSKTMPCTWGTNPQDGGPAIMILEAVIITAALNPDKLVAKAGEERLKERVRKVLSGVIAKLESDPRMNKSIGECKSKQEEDKILASEVSTLKQIFTTQLTDKKLKEALMRVMYAEMLGHHADFGHIHAVNMTQKTNLVSKRVGYMASAACLHPGHELVTLAVNTMRRDVASSNHVEVCAALIAIPKLVSKEFLPALLQPVLALLDHAMEAIRKKAVMVLHKFYTIEPESMASHTDKLRRALCDKDPAVMGAALYILHAMAEQTPAHHKDLVPSYVSILKQITEHRLPSTFDYHRVPAPWIQIKLLKLLALLGTNDQRASEGMYEVLNDVMRRADTGINIGYAVIYDCVRTVTTIYPNIPLLEAAAGHIARFVQSENHNLKYLGIKALAQIVQVNQKYALDHQMVVVECLEDPDETLKRKTLDLLFAMTNASNIIFVADTLLGHLRSTTDQTFRGGLVDRITQLAERYAPDNTWYIRTMNAVFELGGELVRPDIAHNLMRLIAEGSGEDEAADMAMRKYAASQYYELLEKPVLPDNLVQVLCWVLGEYGYLVDGTQVLDIATRLCGVIKRQLTHVSTRNWVLGALVKLVAQLGQAPSQVTELAQKYSRSADVTLAKYANELLVFREHMDVMKAVLPVDASCEDLETDRSLSFLNGYVQAAVANGAQPYLKRGQRPADLEAAAKRAAEIAAKQPAQPTMRFEEYERAQLPVMSAPPAAPEPSAPAVEETPPPLSSGLNTSGVKQMWGAEGFMGDKPAPAPTPAQVFTPA